MGITNINCSSRYSYSGIVYALGANINDAHVNGRHPIHSMWQEVIYLMTCITLSSPEDIKPLLRIVTKVIRPPNLEEDRYATVNFLLKLGEPRNT